MEISLKTSLNVILELFQHLLIYSVKLLHIEIST